MKLIDIPKHSIVMTIGPSNSGKSYLMTNVLMPNLIEMGVRAKYLSSDNYRRDMIGDVNRHKHGEGMQAVSKQAFDMLHTALDLYTQYPVNQDVVIVDATNLSKIARAKIIEIAKKNAYNVVGLLFDYREMSDYVKYVDAGVNKKVIYDMVKTMRTNTLKELDKSQFDVFHKIDSIDFSGITFTYSEDKNGVQVNHDNVCFVGDLHGCYDEFIELLNDKKGMEVDGETMEIKVLDGAIENNTYVHHVLVGDIIDKGPHEGQRKLVEFLTKNRDHFTIVEGNHDRWVYGYLKGKIKKSADTETLIASWFDGVRLFESDEELKKKFLKLYESMSTYAYSDKFIVTHSPVEAKHLGKNDKVSLKKQNTTRYPKRADYASEELYLNAREEHFSYLIKEGENNQPLHIFGHVALSQVFQNKNKYGIDTGVVSGNYLTGLVLMKENRKPFVRKYKSRQPVKDQLIPMFRIKANDIDFSGLERDLQTRLKWCAKNQVNFVSGTMSPCDKLNGDLESLMAGINYYRGKGMTRIMLQPKFMGSRCNVLLHKTDVTKCKAISRNAYEIKQERLHTDGKLEDVFMGLQKKYNELFDMTNAEYILFDGELLPWNSMGKELIERDFMLAYKACSTELAILKETGFEDKLSEFTHTVYDVDDVSVLPKHLQNLRKTYEKFENDILHTDIMEDSLNKYKHQLDVFNVTTPLEFSPFSILKVVRKDGSEENWVSGEKTNFAIYNNFLMKDTWMILDWSETLKIEPKFMASMSTSESRNLTHYYNLESALNAFWDYITKQNEMEGVVIKPDVVYTPGVAPFLKCRNKEYLRLTYGFEYDALPVKAKRLYENKSIRKKMETSIKEWELARKMLDVPLNQISIENKEWLNLTVQLLSEQEREKELDPRL
jgi:predicted kinase